jgi:hypothetical protein
MRATQVLKTITATMGVCVLAMAVPAAAQTPAAPKPTAPTMSASADSGFHIAVLGGLAAVQNVGGLVGAEAGYKVNRNVEIDAEGFWMQDAVSRARLDAATGLATYLTSSLGKATTAVIKAPTTYGGGGVKLFIPMDGDVHPYVTVGAGVARVVLTPTITVAGADVTASLATYGVTLGSDFTGAVTKAAINGGLGVQFDRNKLAIDLGIRLTSIQTDGQKTNVLRAHVGFGYKF